MIAVVIPAFKCKDTIMSVLEGIGPEVDSIIVVEDACPDASGEFVVASTDDARVEVLFHECNKGVGGAVVTGMKHAIAIGSSIVVKVDSDGQMNTALIPNFIQPILSGRSDYVKGNRFFNVEDLSSMPAVRLIGNAGLSFLSKMSSGYWSLMDPTNGYFAIHTKVLETLPLGRLSERYFFESDMLFQLSTVRACISEVAIESVYGSEVSGLSPLRSLFEFPFLHANRFAKRFFYNYLLRGFNAATLMSIFGAFLFVFGVLFGGAQWYESFTSGELATTGTIMIAVLPVVLGFQLLLSAVQYDVASEPKKAIHPYL